jgi:hypothetical protein
VAALPETDEASRREELQRLVSLAVEAGWNLGRLGVGFPTARLIWDGHGQAEFTAGGLNAGHPAAQHEPTWKPDGAMGTIFFDSRAK